MQLQKSIPKILFALQKHIHKTTADLNLIAINFFRLGK